MPKLDGTEKIIHTPYDAHEQVVRKSHTHSLERGYEPKVEEPEPEPKEEEREEE